LYQINTIIIILTFLLSFRYEKAAQAQEDTEESLKRRPMSASEPELPSQVNSINNEHNTFIWFAELKV